jgi:hypothetical protein
VGLGFFLQTAFLFPLTVFALLLAVAALGYRANWRRGYLPFAVGSGAALLVVLGKFVLDSNVLLYGGIAALVAASLWNSWPTSGPVAPTGTLHHLGSINKGDWNMAAKRKVEVFSAGCPVCQETVALVQQVACPSCDVSVLDMNDPNVAQRAKGLGIRSVPAVVIDGKLADCCQGRGPEEATLRAAGLGQTI